MCLKYFLLKEQEKINTQNIIEIIRIINHSFYNVNLIQHILIVKMERLFFLSIIISMNFKIIMNTGFSFNFEFFFIN
jgi:hypothetical protein